MNAGLWPKLSFKSASALAGMLILFWDATAHAEHLANTMSSMMKNARMQEHVGVLTLASFPHIEGRRAKGAAYFQLAFARVE